MYAGTNSENHIVLSSKLKKVIRFINSTKQSLNRKLAL